MKVRLVKLKCNQRIKSAMLFTIVGGFGVLLSAPAVAQTEREPIVIEITTPLADATIDSFICSVEGTASSLRPLELLAINRQQLINAADSSTTQLHFDRKVPLLSGQNIIEVIARDNTGNSVVKTISVFVKNENVDEKDVRLKLPIAVLRSSNKYSELAIPERLADKLIEANRFAVMDHEEMSQILIELNLSAEMLTDGTTLNMGKLIAAAFVIKLEYSQVGAELTILAKIIDAVDGKLFATVDVMCRDPSAVKNVQDAAELLASRIQRIFLKVNGYVSSVRGDQVLIQIAVSGTVRLGTHILILRTDIEQDELTGEILASKNFVLGRGRVTQINQTSVICTITTKEADITPGMMAVTW